MRDYELMEQEVLCLLQQNSNNDYAKYVLAPWIAKTSLKIGHLYSDLGLKSRKEMGEFMQHYFTDLALIKPKDVRWKKYLYDTIGKVAPACATCGDVSNCFHCSLS